MKINGNVTLTTLMLVFVSLLLALSISSNVYGMDIDISGSSCSVVNSDTFKLDNVRISGMGTYQAEFTWVKSGVKFVPASATQQSPRAASGDISLDISKSACSITGAMTLSLNNISVIGYGTYRAGFSWNSVDISFIPKSANYFWQVIDTNQSSCYNNTSQITCPGPGQSFYGQDGQYTSISPSYKDNGDGTVTDLSTGLMWQKNPGGKKTWMEAMNGAATFNLAGYTDWRLPNAKELQSIVDYTRSPATTNSAAINPIFNTTQIIDEGGAKDYPFYWAGTTHVSYNDMATDAVYVAFGKALGWMSTPPSGGYVLYDVHGAGAQRSDPKTGNPADYPYGHGPQGDVIRIYNYARCVRTM
ncbi:MAG: DUF1566 domain-containing protein [Nitrospirae bacterium]|nr:DUF1566 domain-containing protein [Nitrospirota bacterium]